METNQQTEAFTTTTCNIWLRDGFAARPLSRVAPWAATWDGVPEARFALESPTQLSSDGCTIRSYVEVKVTGRKWRFHPGSIRDGETLGSHRMTCRVRFLNEDAADDGEWIVADIVVGWRDLRGTADIKAQREQALADCGVEVS